MSRKQHKVVRAVTTVVEKASDWWKDHVPSSEAIVDEMEAEQRTEWNEWLGSRLGMQVAFAWYFKGELQEVIEGRLGIMECCGTYIVMQKGGNCRSFQSDWFVMRRDVPEVWS